MQLQTKKYIINESKTGIRKKRRDFVHFIKAASKAFRLPLDTLDIATSNHHVDSAIFD